MVAVVCSSAGCGHFHKKARLPQPATDNAGPKYSPYPPEGPLNPPPQSLPEMKPVPAKEPAPATDETVTEPKQEPPSREKRAAPRRTAPKPEPVIEAAPVGPPPAPPAAQPAEIPRIAPILSDAQARELNQGIEAALTSAERNLRAVRARDRNAQQQKILEQAEGFARQARQFRESDPVSAKSFAEKADQLSRELVSSYR